MRFLALALALFATPLAAQMASAPAAPIAPPPLTAENTLHLVLSNGGRVLIQLRPDIAPNHVERIKTLARRGFYNGLAFHRVIPGFMAQGGDPKGDGTGGSELPDIAAEFNALPHVRGAAAMARAENPNSANSQFYIMLAPRMSLDGKYTVWGRVVGGMNHVDAIAPGEPPAEPTRIVQAHLGNEAPAAAAAASVQTPAPTD